jgi:hypothetical protein
MSTGLKIHKATYGVGSTTEDVTGAVSSMVKDGVLNFTVSPTTLNVEDPAPGQTKTLNVSYTVNDGSTNSLSKKDNDLIFIDAPPQRLASGLQIKKAEYGYVGNWTDVTDAIQNHVKDGAINITVGFKTAGIPDPNPNKQKQLQVDYEINGAPSVATFNDGDTFKVSAPPREGGGVSSDFDLGSILSWTFKGFVAVISFYTAKKLGDKMVGSVVGWIFGGIALMSYSAPLLGSGWTLITIFPMITFWVRLFKSADIITESDFGPKVLPITASLPV